ncbi:YHYH protein [Ilumatobacter sp.]|uniref:YHYH protein n=1 Tax=Ilumatobacter sp. TaxID=1967498 RepID=UPI003C37B065
MNVTTPLLCRSVAVLAAGAMTIASCGSDSDVGSDTATSDDTTADTAATAETGADSTDADSTATGTETDETAADASTGDADTTAGVEAAQWGDNVTVTVSDTSFRFESDGLPNHELADEYLVPTTGSFDPPVDETEVAATSSDVAVVESPVDQEITLNPVYSDTTTETNLGIIGVAISGAQLFNDYEDTDRSFVAVDDNITIDGVDFVDSCNGHPLALAADGTGQGNYHYHGVPYCITDAVDADGEHSTIIGVLLDGFPFYGPQDADGVTITSDDLDECSGHVGVTPEFPDGIYHYHLTEDRSPYTVDCYHGEIDAASTTDAGGPPDGEGPPEG